MTKATKSTLCALCLPKFEPPPGPGSNHSPDRMPTLAGPNSPVGPSAIMCTAIRVPFPALSVLPVWPSLGAQAYGHLIPPTGFGTIRRPGLASAPPGIIVNHSGPAPTPRHCPQAESGSNRRRWAQRLVLRLLQPTRARAPSGASRRSRTQTGRAGRGPGGV